MNTQRGDTEIKHYLNRLFPNFIYQFHFINEINFFYSFGEDYDAGQFCVARFIVKPKQNASSNSVQK